jgi:parallel beta-helix repeat protein
MYLNWQEQVESMRKAIIFALAFLLLLLPLAKADVFFTNQNPPNLAQRDDLHPFLNASIQPYSNVSTSLNCSLYVDNVLNQTVNDIANNTVVYLNSSTLSQGDHSWYINCTDDNWATQAQSEVRTIGIGSSFSRCGVLIDDYGSYQLTADIINSEASTCISIPNNHTILDCQGHIIDGTDNYNTYGIYVYRFSTANPIITNITIKNCVITDWDTGIYFFFASSNTLSNIITNSNYRGILLSYSDSNTLTNITANFNSYHGIVLSTSSHNTLTNITANFNSYHGIFIAYSGNTIKNSIIQGNSGCGIILLAVGTNLIYNNLFNNTNNFCFSGTIYPNYWNTTRQAGTRIYSAGTEIGGNYWTNPEGTGYSDTCTDADKDGFCDDPYVLATDNVDYLPLSNQYSPPTLPPVHGVPLLSSTLVGLVIGSGIIIFMLRTLFDIRDPKKVIEYFIVLAVIVLTVLSLIALFG